MTLFKIKQNSFCKMKKKEVLLCKVGLADARRIFSVLSFMLVYYLFKCIYNWSALLQDLRLSDENVGFWNRRSLSCCDSYGILQKVASRELYFVFIYF